MRRHNAPRFRACRAGLLLATGLLLPSCGTDLRGMMAEDGALFWEADQTIGEAEGRDPALTIPVRRAEAAKDEACQFMADGATERMNNNDPTLWEGFVSDFGQLVALVFPVPMVERCAGAQAAYRQSLDDLRQQLNAATETALR